MYYINSVPTENGSYGNPQSNARPGMYALPDDLLGAYIDSMGFVLLAVSDGVVTSVSRNEAAYDAYQEAHPDTPEPEPEESTEELLLDLAADHEERICLLEMGVIA